MMDYLNTGKYYSLYKYITDAINVHFLLVCNSITLFKLFCFNIVILFNSVGKDSLPINKYINK